MRKLLACSVACLLTLNGTVLLQAQTTPASRTQPKVDEETVALKEFVVSETEDKGYAATSTSSVTRTQSALIDTPTVVNVLTRAFIEDTQAGELYDALKYVPGVSLESNVGDSVMMRGYTVRNQFTDGIFDNQNQSQMGAEPFQYERLEVLKGPAALVYGSTAIGGLVNRVRKQPQFKRAGQAAVTIGNNNQQKVEFDYTAPINERIAYRVIAVYRNEDMVNGAPVRFAYARRWNLNPSLTWKPTDTTQVRIIGEFMREKSFKHWGETGMYSTLVQNNSLLGTFFPHPAGTVTTKGLTAEQGGISTFGVLPRDFTFMQPDSHVDNHKQAGWLSLESQITPEWSLRTLGTVTFWDHFVLDGGIPVGMARNNREMTRLWRTISNDDFAATFAMDSVYNARIFQTEHKFLSILQAQYQSNYQDIYNPGPTVGGVVTNQVPNIDIYNPNYDLTGRWSPNLTIANQQYVNTYNFSWAAQDHVKLMGDKLQLVGGARYDWFGTQSRNFLAVSNQNSNRNASQLWTYKYGAVVKPIKGLAAFYNHSETYTPNFGVQPDGTTFDHQQGTIDEIGLKSAMFDGRIAGTISAYELELTNLISNDPDPVRAAQGWRIQNDYQRVTGFEADLFLSVTPNWQVNLGGGKMNIRLPIAVGQAALHGDKLQPRGSPEHTANAWTRYDFRQGPLKGFAFGGGATYKGKAPVDGVNFYYLAPVTVFDAFAQYAWKKYRFALNVSNVTDKYYLQRGVSKDQVFQGGRRLIKLRVSRSF